jgi:hypothetical protein
VRTANNKSNRVWRDFGYLGVLVLLPLSFNSDVRGQCATCQAAKGANPSVMGQGEAKIAVQSNVRISVKGQGATSRQRVEALSEAVRGKTAALKACYAKAVSDDPTKQGALEVALTFADTPTKPKVEIGQTADFTSNMLDCVRGVLASIALEKEHRPAAARVTVAFTNSRAQGQQTMQESAEQADLESVHTNAQGKLEATWSAPGQTVTLTTTAEPSASKRALVEAQRALKKSLGAFLDCRRRAAKGSASRAGETEVSYTWSSRPRRDARILSSNLRNQTAVTCIKKVFARLSYENVPDSVQMTTRVIFGE